MPKKILEKKELVLFKQYKHVKSRLRQRYRITDSTKRFIKEAMNQIHTVGKVVHKCSSSIKVYDVDYQGKTVYVLYNKKARRIKTVLTKRQIDQLTEQGEGHYNG